MQYELIPATAADHEWLETLRRAVYADLFQATWGGWDEARHARHFSECIEHGNIRIIMVGGDRIGMIQLFDRPDAVEVGEIQIDLEHQNQRIGTRVLRDVLADAHRNRKSVRLSVGLKNDNARRLYERLGFRRVATSETHDHMESRP